MTTPPPPLLHPPRPTEPGFPGHGPVPVSSPGPQCSPAERAPPLFLSEYTILRPIGRGAIGRVFLCAKQHTADLYAIKVMRKDEVARKNMRNRVSEEVCSCVQDGRRALGHTL